MQRRHIKRYVIAFVVQRRQHPLPRQRQLLDPPSYRIVHRVGDGRRRPETGGSATARVPKGPSIAGTLTSEFSITGRSMTSGIRYEANDGLRTAPRVRSNCWSSVSARPMPGATPPSCCPATAIGLMAVPGPIISSSNGVDDNVNPRRHLYIAVIVQTGQPVGCPPHLVL